MIYQKQTELQTVQRATFYLVAISSTSILNLSKRQKQGFEKHQHLSSSLQLFPYVNKKGKTVIGPCGKKLAKEINIYAHARLLSCIWFSVNPWTIAQQAPLSMKFSRQEYWSRLPFLPPGDLPDPEIELRSPVAPALAGGSLTAKPPGKPSEHIY